jgi:hypothetical protein
MNNDLSRAAQSARAGPEVPKNALTVTGNAGGG